MLSDLVTLMTDFGTRLKRLRKEQDVTQAQLAEYLGVVSSAVGKYETVDNAYPSVEALIKIAEFFHVSIDYLLLGVTPDIKQSGDNNVNGSLSNSSVIQASRGGVIYNNDGSQSLSPEAVELLRVYETLDGRGRLKLLNFAVELEERSKAE